MINVTKEILKSYLPTRENDSHKGNYGHALLICGCKTMPGAASLATGAALQSGCGLVTLHSTENATTAAMVNYPSAMLSIDLQDCFSGFDRPLSKYSSIGIGPGLGQDEKTVKALKEILIGAKQASIPMVIDADALNIISANPDFLDLIPDNSILTPHIGELKRLVGDWDAIGERDEKILLLCRRINGIIVCKGFRTKVFLSDGTVFENTTGNPGMAKGGSGDVLTGLCTGLLARCSYSVGAALLAVWIHGYAGDYLSEERTPEAYSSKDMIDVLWRGFKELFR